MDCSFTKSAGPFHSVFSYEILKKSGIIHLVRTQNFPKNYHFVPPPRDTHTYEHERVRIRG